MTSLSIGIIIVPGIREKFARPEFANVMEEPSNRYAPFTTFYKNKILVNKHVFYAIDIVEHDLSGAPTSLCHFNESRTNVKHPV